MFLSRGNIPCINFRVRSMYVQLNILRKVSSRTGMYKSELLEWLSVERVSRDSMWQFFRFSALVSLNSINRLDFVLKTHCALCDVGIE